jgi:hypothetical protein
LDRKSAYAISSPCNSITVKQHQGASSQGLAGVSSVRAEGRDVVARERIAATIASDLRLKVSIL